MLARARRAAATVTGNGDRRFWVNHEGGDVGGGGTGRGLVRHVANYLAAACAAGAAGVDGPVTDVGCGVGALGVWLGSRLGADVHLVDRDPQLREIARVAFPEVAVGGAIAEAPLSGLVTAMEVVEHVAYPHQEAFVTGLWDRVRPGGLLVVSTPDESRFVGGWSGYGPHIGVLDAGGLRSLLRDTTGAEPFVWRLEGWAFMLGPLRRVLQPVANRAWAGVHGLLPELAAGVAGPTTSLLARLVPRRHGDSAARDAAADPDRPGARVRALPAQFGRGTGLLAVVPRPAL